MTEMRSRDLIAALDEASLSRFHLRAVLVSGMGFFTDAYDLFVIGIAASAVSAMIRVICAGRTLGACGRTSHNPPVVGSSPTRPTCGLLPGKRAGPTFGTSPPHICLVWALESLAWSSAHMSRVAATLARLAKIDPEPDANTHPRPAGSLADVFNLYDPQTSVPFARRLDELDGLRRRSPAEAWWLLRAILPTRLTIFTVVPSAVEIMGSGPARDLSVDLFGHRPRLPGIAPLDHPAAYWRHAPQPTEWRLVPVQGYHFGR